MEQIRDRLDPVIEVAKEYATEVDADAAFPKASVEALRASGLMGLTLPRSSGGLGYGLVEFTTVTRALARACGSTAMVYLMHSSAAMCMAAAPPTGLPDALQRMAAGDWLATLAFSEKGSRSHFWAPVSQAVANNGHLRVATDKSFVTSAGHADLYVVSSLSPDEGVDLYAVPATDDGLAVSSRWTGMGLRGNASAPMSVDLEIDAGRRLGDSGEGFRLMMEAVLPWFNLGNAAVSLGLAEAAVTGAVAHASSARFEHLESTLASLPTIRAQLARMQIALDTSLAYLRSTAEAVANGDEAAPLHVMAVKAQANDAALEITDAAMRVCGGAAYARSLQVDRYFRDARAGHVMAPTADVLYDLYGKAITGQELF